MKTAKDLPNREKGQSLIEVTLVLPIILLLFIGMAEVGWALHSYVTVATSAREATRFGARANFEQEEIAKVALTAMGEPTGPDVNTTVMVTFIDIDPSGNYTITTPYITGTLPVTSSIFLPITSSRHLDIQEIAQANVAFNNPNDPANCPQGVLPPCPVNSRSDLVLVEVFYQHMQLLGLPIVSDILTNPISMYSRGVMRLGNSRAD